MFYTQLFTSKRGPLAKIWLAAHWEKKITKAHVFECNLENTIQELISPQIKIGLRTSGHLLLGVVRIYSRKAKYLLADCSDAVLKIKVAFRPGQTDLPSENLEATLKAITLSEDFADFNTQLPDVNAIEVTDHFSLNQCRTEDITLKEDLGNSFLMLPSDFGEESHLHQGGLFDVSFPSLAGPEDGFGDEELGVEFLDFMAKSVEDVVQIEFALDDAEKETPATPPPTAVSQGQPSIPSPSPSPGPRSEPPTVQPEAPTLDETTLLLNEEEGFTLEPVCETPSSDRKRVKRKRKLLVDTAKELTNEEIRDQIVDANDLLSPLDMAPPTRQLLMWKETGSVHKLFHNHCVPVIHPHLQQLFPTNLFPRRSKTEQDADGGDPEQMRSQQKLESEGSRVEFGGDSSLLQDSQERDLTGRSIQGTPRRTPTPRRLSNLGICRAQADNAPLLTAQEGTLTEVSVPDLPSEDSMCVHPSGVERESLQTQTQTQLCLAALGELWEQSALDSQDFEEKSINIRARDLLNTLRSQTCAGGSAEFSLLKLVGGCSRMQASATFFCFLVLKKQRGLELHQDTPYADIIATPGPAFRQL